MFSYKLRAVATKTRLDKKLFSPNLNLTTVNNNFDSVGKSLENFFVKFQKLPCLHNANHHLGVSPYTIAHIIIANTILKQIHINVAESASLP